MHIVNADGIQEIPKNILRKWDIISIKKEKEYIYRAVIVLSEQVLFWGNFCALLHKKFSSLPTQDEIQNEIFSWNYRFYFIDFYEALKAKRVYETEKKFPTQSIFWGKIKMKEYLEDFDEITENFQYSTLNNRERLSEKELEDFVLTENESIVPLLLDIIYPEEVEETQSLELLAFQQDIVEQNWYFYSIKEIDKLEFTPLTMVKPDVQTPEEKEIPEVDMVVEKIDFIL